MPVLVYVDRVRETTTTTGTGTITLAGAATSFQSFNAAFGVGPSFEYCVSSPGGAEWEIGVGHLSASTTLVRDSVSASSNANALVNFSAGTKDIRGTISGASLVLLGPTQVTDYSTPGTATFTVPNCKLIPSHRVRRRWSGRWRSEGCGEHGGGRWWWRRRRRRKDG